ncbi:MAG: GGDEF domain-containing protein [Silvibacterium sp.]
MQTETIPVLLLLMFSCLSVRDVAARPGSSGPVWTTARQAHDLSAEVATRALPVHLRGVVTYYDPSHGSDRELFLADKSGGIFIQTGQAPLPMLRPGMEIEVMGVTDPGLYAPIVKSEAVHILSTHASFPRASSVSLRQLLTGPWDGQWVEIEGIVHSAEMDGMHVHLRIETEQGSILATSVRVAGTSYEALVDATVSLRGVAAPLMDRRRRMLGLRILFPDLNAVSVTEAPPPDPFSQPVQPLSSLFRYSSGTLSSHRIHVRGTITLAWPGERVCFAEAQDMLCAENFEAPALHVGQLVDAVGFLGRRSSLPTLRDAELRVAGEGRPPVARKISANEALDADEEGALVEMEGLIVDTDRQEDHLALLLDVGGMLVPALLPPGSAGWPLSRQPSWKQGSRVRVTGVLSETIDRHHLLNFDEKFSRFESCQLLLRSPQDVQLLAQPSWWNGRHAFEVLGLILLLTVGSLCWSAILRRQVRRQTVIIRRSAEEFRHMAEHDALTGLFARRVLYQRLEAEIRNCAGGSCALALLVIDVDWFKHFNDTLGHAAGDALLCAIARRLQGAVRATDTVARIGGDEFVVLTPGIRSVEEAESIAAKLVDVADAPVLICEGEIKLSLSIGVTTYPEGGSDSSALFRCADYALYRAKARGRNCYDYGGKACEAQPDLTVRLTGEKDSLVLGSEIRGVV